ncbi:MAG: hypothetical protein OXL34_13875 [Gemmatimonadota bacterium]|nr:hypothetical protein [Gemmatimonadota bacterium]
MIACPWYHSLLGLVRGVEKNLFAALDYSLLKMVSASAGLIWLTVALPLPLAALLTAYMIWRSAILTMVRGVAWGGPPVPLAELKAARVYRPAGRAR